MDDEEDYVLKIFDLNTCPITPMENGRGETIRLVNTALGTEKIDLHLNRLAPGGQRRRDAEVRGRDGAPPRGVVFLGRILQCGRRLLRRRQLQQLRQGFGELG